MDTVFLSLADATRRDILRLLSVYHSMTIGEIAAHYRLTFAAVSKHLIVLQTASLIKKRKKGRTQIVSLSAKGFRDADAYIKKFEALWNDQFDQHDRLMEG